MEAFRDILTYVLGPGVGAWLGWFFTRRKIKADAEGGELDNVEKGLGIYRKIIEDLMKGQTELKIQLSSIVKENKSLRESLENFVSENKKLKEENEEFKKRITHLEGDIGTIKAQQQ